MILENILCFQGKKSYQYWMISGPSNSKVHDAAALEVKIIKIQWFHMLFLKHVDEQLLFSSKGNVAIDTFSVRGRGIVPFGIGGSGDPPIPRREILYTCFKKINILILVSTHLWNFAKNVKIIMSKWWKMTAKWWKFMDKMKKICKFDRRFK